MINICFHGVGTPRRELESDEDAYWISSDLYHRVIDEIDGRDDVVVSFDDGNASDLDIGLGPLVDTNRTATFFVLAARLDQAGSLSRDDLTQLRLHGMKIGTHGMDHVPWRGLSPDQTDRELTRARMIIEDAIGDEVSEAALPLGRYDRRVLGELRRRHYSRVFSSDRRRARAGAWLQPRYSLHAGDTIETVRDQILSQPRVHQAAVGLAKGLVKRLR